MLKTKVCKYCYCSFVEEYKDQTYCKDCEEALEQLEMRESLEDDVLKQRYSKNGTDN